LTPVRARGHAIQDEETLQRSFGGVATVREPAVVAETSDAGEMTSEPLITIGLPVYNSARYLRQSLDSLLGQTHSDFVLVISDNASTDETGHICAEYAATDSRIRYHRNAVNLGNPANFNRIAELTTSRYLKWSTSDDYWKPTFLERALEIMERDPSIVLCYPQAVLVDSEGANPTNYDDFLHLVQEDPIERFWALINSIQLAHQHLGLIRMSMLKQTHLLGLHVGSDINLLAELTLYGKFYELPERLFFRRFHKNSGSWKRGDAAHEARWYHPTGKRRATLPMWRRYLGYFGAVSHAPIALRTKMQMYPRLTQQMIWTRDELAKELVQFMGGSS
jgi:glycosyltransferase involved in cell wall biosynthesis